MADQHVFRSPYALTSQLATTGNGTLIPNVQGAGGAVAAGTTIVMPEQDFQHQLDIPFWVTHCNFKVTRPAGGGDVDSDYDNVAMIVRDLVLNQDITKNPVPLSVLGDRFQHRWVLEPGQLVMRKLGGGLKVTLSVLPGAVGAPYNITVGFHGYTEEHRGIAASTLPGPRR